MTAKSLQVAPKLRLPLDFATESIGVMGQRGSGKSNALVVLAECMYDAEIPWFAIDPKGDWWGIQSSADGEGEGLSVPVFGGLHGNAPLEAGMGVAIADLLFDENLTAVLDVSRLTGGELGRFLIDFCHRLFRRHQEEPQVRHGFLEEAHRYIPQQGITGQMAAVKEACAKLPLEGRSFGLGTSTATQRPARLHKDVTTQFGTVVVGKIMAKQDRDAIGGWFTEHEVGKEALSTLQMLSAGEMWTLSPLLGVFERATWRQRRTFDSGATPKVGEAKRVPKRLADVDMGAIKDQLADAIERAEASDPKALQRQVSMLRTTLIRHEGLLHRIAVAARGDAPDVDEHFDRLPGEIEKLWADVNDESRVSVVPTPLVQPDELDTFARLSEVLTSMAPTLEDLVARMKEMVGAGAAAEDGDARVLPMPARRTSRDDHPAVVGARAEERAGAARRRDAGRDQPRPVRAAEGDGLPLHNDKGLTPCGRIMSVLATYGTVSRRRLAMQSGYSAKGGAFNNNLSRLRSAGYIRPGDPVEPTTDGLAALGEFEPLPRGTALINHWLASLTGPQGKLLSALITNGAMDKDDLGRVTGYEPTGGAFNNNLSSLRTLELITRGLPIDLHPDFRAAIEA